MERGSAKDRRSLSSRRRELDVDPLARNRYCVLMSLRSFLSASLLVGICLAAVSVSARSFRVQQIPNGNNFTCDSCHDKQSLLEEDLTPFGVDVNQRLSGGDVVWSDLWDLDSDGDGFSNGLELGDPDGNWRTGQPDPDAPTENPGVPNGGICGNGDAQPGEDCDLSDLRGESCMSLEYGEGTLTCHRLCRWDTRECGFCGDGYLNPNFEDCDGEAFPDDLSCEEYGFLRGELSCTDECDIDLSTCTDEKPAVCGDGVISTGELCDGDNLGTIDCARIAYAGGTLKCDENCQWDASDCLLPDGRRVGDEERAEEAEDTDAGSYAPDGADAGMSVTADADTPMTGAEGTSGGCSVTRAESAASWPGPLLLLAMLFARRRT
jgi:MYXO-CTERM domain-containing protein